MATSKHLCNILNFLACISSCWGVELFEQYHKSILALLYLIQINAHVMTRKVGLQVIYDTEKLVSIIIVSPFGFLFDGELKSDVCYFLCYLPSSCFVHNLEILAIMMMPTT